MPTYVCTVPNGKLDGAQKDAIAKAISIRHSEATGAPPFFVQTIVEESGSATRYLGQVRSEEHIWIRGDIRAGRSDAARGQLMEGILKDVARITGIAEESIWVYLRNLAPVDMIEYGHVLPQPGHEKDWFAALPRQLQDTLTKLGIDSGDFQL